MANTAVFKPAVLFPGTSQLEPGPDDGTEAAIDAADASGVPRELLIDSTPGLPAEVTQRALEVPGQIDLGQLLGTQDTNEEHVDPSDPLAALRKRYNAQRKAKPGQRTVPPAPKRDLGMPSHLAVGWCAEELVVAHVGGPGRNLLFIDAIGKPAAHSDDNDDMSLDYDAQAEEPPRDGSKDAFVLRASPIPTHAFRVPIESVEMVSVHESARRWFPKYPQPWILIRTRNKLLLVSIVRNSQYRVRHKGMPLHSLRTLMDFDAGLPLLDAEDKRIGTDPWSGSALGPSVSGACALLVTQQGKLAWWTLTPPLEAKAELEGSLPSTGGQWRVHVGPEGTFVVWNSERVILLQHRDPSADQGERWEQVLLYTTTPHKAIFSQDQITSVICAPARRVGHQIKGLVYVCTLVEVVCIDVLLTATREQDQPLVRPLRTWSHMRGPDPSLTLALVPLASEDVDPEETWTTPESDPTAPSNDPTNEPGIQPFTDDRPAPLDLEGEGVHHHVLLASHYSRILTAYTPYPLLPPRWAMSQNGLSPPRGRSYLIPSLLPMGMVPLCAPVLWPLSAFAPGWSMRFDCPYALFQLTHTGAILVHGVAHRSGSLAGLSSSDIDAADRSDAEEEDELDDRLPVNEFEAGPIPDGRTKIWPHWKLQRPEHTFPLWQSSDSPEGGPTLMDLDTLCAQRANDPTQHTEPPNHDAQEQGSKVLDYSQVWASALKGTMAESAPGVHHQRTQAQLDQWIDGLQLEEGLEMPVGGGSRATGGRPSLLYEYMDAAHDEPGGASMPPLAIPHAPINGLAGSDKFRDDYTNVLSAIEFTHDVTDLGLRNLLGPGVPRFGEEEEQGLPPVERRAREMIMWDLRLSSSLVEAAGDASAYTTTHHVKDPKPPTILPIERLPPNPDELPSVPYGESWCHHCPQPPWAQTRRAQPMLAPDSAAALVLADWADPREAGPSDTHHPEPIHVSLYPAPTHREIFAAAAEDGRGTRRSRSVGSRTPAQTPSRTFTPRTSVAPDGDAVSMSQPTPGMRTPRPMARTPRTPRAPLFSRVGAASQASQQLPMSQSSMPMSSQSLSQPMAASQAVPGAHANRARKPPPKRRRLGGF